MKRMHLSDRLPTFSRQAGFALVLSLISFPALAQFRQVMECTTLADATAAFSPPLTDSRSPLTSTTGAIPVSTCRSFPGSGGPLPSLKSITFQGTVPLMSCNSQFNAFLCLVLTPHHQ